MLSDEEKKAIELLEECIKILKEFRKYNKIYKEENKDLTITITLEAKESIDKAIETLLTAYEKEKEKNKELEDTLKCTQNSWYEDTKVIEKQSKEIEELKEDLKKKPMFLIKDIYSPKIKEINLQDIEGLIEQGREEVKDKIKAK